MGTDDATITKQNRARQIASTAAALFSSGRPAEAARQFQLALTLWPEHVDLHYNLALAAWGAGDLQTTHDELRRVVEMSPTYAKAHDALARLLINADDAAGAGAAAARALQLEPRNVEFILTAANVDEMQKRFHEAWQRIEPVAHEPDIEARAALLLTRLAKPLVRQTQAIEFARSALAKPGIGAIDRRRLLFALSALLDKIGHYNEAFAKAVSAHEINRPAYDSSARRRDFDLRIDHWTKDRLAAIPKGSIRTPRPILIVGMPRSGTSLIEQILSRHPDVFAAGELAAMPRTAAALDQIGKPYPQSLETMTPTDADRLAQFYLHNVPGLGAAQTTFTDKMPLNFMYLELIDRLFPNAKVIHCVRDRRDTCLSCFMTDFATPYDFASSIEDLVGFHHMYESIMPHWKQVLTVPMLDVQYETVVEHLDSEVKRILAFLDLPWDERCLRFHESDRRVITASKEQVKQPLYRSSVGRWRNYASHLMALQQ